MGESRYRAYRYSDNGVSDEQFLLPMQDQAAGEMPTGLDGRDTWQHFFSSTGRTFD